MNPTLISSVFLLILGFDVTLAQRGNQVTNDSKDIPQINWCVIGDQELKKCQSFSMALQRDKNSFGGDYMVLGCVKGFNKEDCMSMIEQEKAQLTTLDAGELFTAGRFHSLVPILQELYSGNFQYYSSVAVVKKGSLKDVTNLRHLRGKKACFPSVGILAGWVIPVETLMRRGGLEIVDCNNHVKSAIMYFGPSCAVNSLHDKFNPIGDNSDKLCQLCVGKVGEKCTTADPYAGFTGAFRCLLEAGDIAFLKHTTVAELTGHAIDFPSVSKDDFELLCLDGTRKSVDDYKICNWGEVPSHAVVTSSAKSIKTRRNYQRFLQKAVQLYGGEDVRVNQSTNRYNERTFQGFSKYDEGSSSTTPQNVLQYETFSMFESVPRYGNQYNLIFEDVAENLMALEESKQTYTKYLGKQLDLMLALRKCPIVAMTLCVTSEPELEKCVKMRTALKAQLLKPEMSCYKGHSHIHCMQAIKNGDADVAVFDAGDIYTGGLRYGLIPFMAEVYNLGGPEYYVVAVAKEDDPDTELTYLRGKNTCHSGINTGAGWVVPLAYQISNGWMRSYGCNAVRAAAEYFSKSCVPGALSSEYNTGVPYENMCHLCHGGSYRYCRRDAMEDYYGHTGAFRCLVEGGGHVAFVKHTTVQESTGGKRREWWARNALTSDFQLLCPDGTRAPVQEYKRCNLGKVKANAIVTRGGEAYNEAQINAYINLFVYAQQFYGRKDFDDFNFAMFYSIPPYSDLIFQDATTQLMVLKPSEREYSSYLGKDFMRAKRIVDCHAFSPHLAPSPFLMFMSVFTTVLAFILGRIRE